MQNIYILIILFLIFKLLEKKKIEKKEKQRQQSQTTESKKTQNQNQYTITDGYKPKWVFTINEKNTFRMIQKISQEMGYTALAKVRLFDLVEPKYKNEKNQTYQWKIQAKHVDFVICDEKLVARWVIEQMDNSHLAPDRIERDAFVRDVLNKCGYKYLEIYTPDEETIRAFLTGKLATCTNASEK